jgi:ABC-2 type transport system permease protein
MLPLTFSVDALQEIAGNSTATAAMWQDVGIMASVVLAVLVLAALTLRRSTP